MRTIRPELTQKQAKAIIKMIVKEQGLISSYGDPARWNHSDMEFYNILEGLLVKLLGEAKLMDKDEEERRGV